MPTRSPDVYIEEERVIIAPDDATLSRGWPLNWGAIWVGVLAALAVALMIGLIGIAVGAHHVGKNAMNLSDMTFAGLVLSIAGSFFAFVLGGWAAGKIAGLRRAEYASLQGATVWLIALPLLIMFAALGAGGFFGAWYGGLAGTPVWAAGSADTDAGAALAARNSALGAVTALLIGLMGSIIGGWLASGEPMTLTTRHSEHEFQPDHG